MNIMSLWSFKILIESSYRLTVHPSYFKVKGYFMQMTKLLDVKLELRVK